MSKSLTEYERTEWFLREFEAADQMQLEDGGVEIYGEDAEGREGSCFVTTQDMCKQAADLLNQQKAEIDALRSQLANQSTQKWFAFDPDTGFETFDSCDKAKEYAASCIESYLDETWAEEVEGVCIGIVLQEATQTNKKPVQGEGYDYTCDYELKPISIAGASNEATGEDE